MLRPIERPLNRLERELPEGVLVDTAWLRSRGYSRQLLSHYAHTGWLSQPAPGVYRRPRGALSWEQVVIPLQGFLDCPLTVGGRTALELHGCAHYLPYRERQVHLCGPKPPPWWLKHLPLGMHFHDHNDGRLFRKYRVAAELERMRPGGAGAKEAPDLSLTERPWPPWGWKLFLSTPERAVLELPDELPGQETFHQVDVLMQGMTRLSPRRLQKLLTECKSVKVKRLFFFYAGRHAHVWLKPINGQKFDLGTGKRMLVNGGRFDQTYRINVPRDLKTFRDIYGKQATLLVRIPVVVEEPCFALKGGTAINMFIGDFPRLSGDIDRTDAPVAPRSGSFDAAMKRISGRVRTIVEGAHISASQLEGAAIKLTVREVRCDEQLRQPRLRAGGMIEGMSDGRDDIVPKRRRLRAR